MGKNSRMFHIITQTWNPITGCYHNCIYCYARRFANRFKKTSKKYCYRFRPTFHEEELSKRFRKGSFVFVCDMGDLFGDWLPAEWIQRVLEVVSNEKNVKFLLLTKNPKRYFEFVDYINSDHIYVGITIETDNDKLFSKLMISRAPPPSERLELFRKLNVPNKFISVEPIMDFSNKFAEKIASVKPLFVYVGYDNYNNRLPEPTMERTVELMETLKSAGITVYKKTIREAWYLRNKSAQKNALLREI